VDTEPRLHSASPMKVLTKLLVTEAENTCMVSFVYLYLFIYLAILRVELRVLHWLGRCSTA
jgi:hypothetical protein